MEGQELNEWLVSHDKGRCYFTDHRLVLWSYRPWRKLFARSYGLTCTYCGEMVTEPLVRERWYKAICGSRPVSPGYGVMAPGRRR